MKAKATVRKKRPAPAKPREASQKSVKNDFLIVAIGASAGGMQAFTELIRSLRADTGMAFVLIQHLDPKHHSILAELLARETVMKVAEVSEGMKAEPNRVYVIPPNASMTITDHKFHLSPRGDSPAAHMTTDQFMRSLAEDHGNRAVGVILSGTGSDGTLGMVEIQAHGGITFAQDESTAKYDGMPRSAIAAGCVDYVLPPKEIAHELARIARHPYVFRDRNAESAELLPIGSSGLGSIFNMLRRATGLDFTHYRQTTIVRRIHRRMVVHKIEKLDEYVKYLQSNPAELKALYQDMLINVTSFFRNPRVFDALKSQVFPNIFKSHPPDSTIRLWTPGCASGEETYSLAILLLEFLGEKASHVPIQLFGTDVSESSITRARAGLYPENIRGDVAPDRLRRYFTQTEGGFRISKNIRDICIFAQHNLLNDPPFSQMDLICCRNLLIYLEPVLQNKAISLFHYAIRPGGYLVLGTSEGVGHLSSLFAPEDRAFKIFSKKATAARQVVSFSLNRGTDVGESASAAAHPPNHLLDIGSNYAEAQKEFDRRLLTQFVPATVFINEDLEIVHSRGNVNRYLKLAPGRPSLSILKMAREGLLIDLRAAINRAKKENTTVAKKGIRIKTGDAGEDSGSSLLVNFQVIPFTLGTLQELYFIAVFQDAPPEPTRQKQTERAVRGSETANRRIAKLEHELSAAQEYLQSVVETQEATNEALQSANEEILSSNEELQSTNEELETAKEELQSTNEELSTVNDELRSRNLDVNRINNDLTNLLGSVDIAMVIVGSDLSIRRFTPKAQKIFGLIPGDIGRPMQNINPTIEMPRIQQMVQQVMESSESLESELTDRSGSRYQLRILPYRTQDNKIDGAVITIVDIFPRGLAGSA
jgi:two-component system, chemotaxis family, CheB/CheR fusion protein